MAVNLVIGAPVWDRAWALPLWFASVRANVDPSRTGLVFVVPSEDVGTRKALERLSLGFAWIEIQRDRMDQSERRERPETSHETLAVARNQILRIVNEAKPDHFISWDTDFLVPPATVSAIRDKGLPLTTVWAWLNRQQPRLIRHFDGKEYQEVWWQPPVCATAMGWDRAGGAMHYAPHEFLIRGQGLWRCGVALAFQVMDRRAYAVGRYAPHHDGEDVPFNQRLARVNVPRFCWGDVRGVHLYDRDAADERAMGWPGVMTLAEQVPLAASWTEPRSLEYTAFGFYPVRSEDAHTDGSGRNHRSDAKGRTAA